VQGADERRALWRALEKTQCPLMPDRYDKSGINSAVYYFNNAFWMKDDENDKDEDCRVVRFRGDTKEERNKVMRQCKDDAELMVCHFFFPALCTFLHCLPN
jgi:hypothetical protein